MNDNCFGLFIIGAWRRCGAPALSPVYLHLTLLQILAPHHSRCIKAASWKLFESFDSVLLVHVFSCLPAPPTLEGPEAHEPFWVSASAMRGWMPELAFACAIRTEYNWPRWDICDHSEAAVEPCS